MEEQLTIMLTQLANELGTTIEMLWGVILKQAQISALLSIAWIGFVLLYGGTLYIKHKEFSKPDKKNYGRTKYFEDDLTGIVMNLLLLVWIITAAVGILEIQNAVTALLNPEYWALQEILEKCR